MSFLKELKLASVVVVARNFNPSIFTQQWLIEKGVLVADVAVGPQIFTPQFVHVSNDGFRLTVLPEQLMFEVINSPQESFVKRVNEKLIPILSALNETPFAAVGVNFQWHIDDKDRTIATVSKDLFDKGVGIYSEFSTSDARYGAYMSKDFLNSRLKLDIKPVIERQESGLSREFIVSAFNFHKDLFSADRHNELLRVVRNCDSFLQESNKILIRL